MIPWDRGSWLVARGWIEKEASAKNSNEGTMARMRFSVPDEVKKQFDREFPGENKSHVIARMMIEAIEELRLQGIRASDARRNQRGARKPITTK